MCDKTKLHAALMNRNGSCNVYHVHPITFRTQVYAYTPGRQCQHITACQRRTQPTEKQTERSNGTYSASAGQRLSLTQISLRVRYRINRFLDYLKTPHQLFMLVQSRKMGRRTFIVEQSAVAGFRVLFQHYFGRTGHSVTSLRFEQNTSPIYV